MTSPLPACTLAGYPDGNAPGKYPKEGFDVPPNEHGAIRRVISIINFWGREWCQWGCALAMRVSGLGTELKALEARVAKLEQGHPKATGSSPDLPPVIGETTQPPPPPFKGGSRD